jgi:hypothetical protein
MAVVKRPRRIRLARAVDDDFHHHLAGGLEDQRQREARPFGRRFGHTHQHDVIPAAGEVVHGAGGQRHAGLDRDHLHQAIGAFDVGVKLGHSGELRARADQAVIGFAVVVQKEKHRARPAAGRREARIGVVDMDGDGMLLRHAGRGDKDECGGQDSAAKHGKPRVFAVPSAR